MWYISGAYIPAHHNLIQVLYIFNCGSIANTPDFSGWENSMGMEVDSYYGGLKRPIVKFYCRDVHHLFGRVVGVPSGNLWGDIR